MHAYNQLVENYRENGHHRQHVLAHLGHHDTVEEAIEGARRKLADLDTSRLAEQVDEAKLEAAAWERRIHRDFSDQLARYHDGEIPTLEEVAKRTGKDKEAPVVEEVEVEGYFGTYKKPVYGEVPIPAEVDEYCRAFGDGTVEEREDPDRYGHTVYYPDDLYDYERSVKNLWSWRREVEEKRTEYERRRQYYRDRIARLEQASRSLRGD